jgi:hypothetical protein
LLRFRMRVKVRSYALHIYLSRTAIHATKK